MRLSFQAMTSCTMILDNLEEENRRSARLGAFAATLIAFFLVEMGDKTQIATAALAARYASIAAVVAGTTPGMMLADVPAVYFGERILGRGPAKSGAPAGGGGGLLRRPPPPRRPRLGRPGRARMPSPPPPQ